MPQAHPLQTCSPCAAATGPYSCTPWPETPAESGWVRRVGGWGRLAVSRRRNSRCSQCNKDRVAGPGQHNSRQSACKPSGDRHLLLCFAGWWLLFWLPYRVRRAVQLWRQGVHSAYLQLQVPARCAAQVCSNQHHGPPTTLWILSAAAAATAALKPSCWWRPPCTAATASLTAATAGAAATAAFGAWSFNSCRSQYG